MRMDCRIKHGVEVRKRAAEFFASGMGSCAVASTLSVPRQTVKEWHHIYHAFGSEVLLTMDGKQALYTYEQKVAAARAVIEGGMTKSEAMAKFKIMSLGPLSAGAGSIVQVAQRLLSQSQKEDLKALSPSHRNAPASRNLRSAVAGSRPR